jgi:hypothetical protein
MFIVGLGWILIMRRLYSVPPLSVHLSIWAVTKLYRFIPGKIWHVVSRLNAYEEMGASRSTVLLGMTVELILVVTSGGLVGIWAYGSWATVSLSGRLAALTVFLMMLAFVLYPGLFSLLLEWASRLLQRRIQVAELNYSLPERIAILGTYLVAWTVKGLAFFLLLSAFEPLPVSLLPKTVCFFALAWLLGFLSFFVPNGLGVREGVLVYLLVYKVGLNPGIASATSIVSRLLTFTAELACAFLLTRGRGRSAAS